MSIISSNEVLSITSLSTLSSSSADNRSSVIVLRNLFFINVIRQNEWMLARTIGNHYYAIMRTANKNIRSYSSSLWINTATSDGNEQPLDLAKATNCVVPSGKKTDDSRSALYTFLPYAVLSFSEPQQQQSSTRGTPPKFGWNRGGDRCSQQKTCNISETG